jgi:serine/threonine protein kinase
MIGKQILNYEIKSVLGEGGMGTVYLAEHVKLGRKVAIKVLLPHLVKNELVRSRFINEAKLMSSLHHPNIVTLYDYHEDENGLSLIMELVDGKPLDEYIQEVTGPIQEKEAVILMKQALEGFAYAHKQGLIHRDIKPSNLIVTESKVIKILDFGIAKLVGDLGNKLTKTGSHIGTVYYMSPEQVRGQELDLRSDIYALGITFYQMLTGLCPYEGLNTEFDVFNKIVGEELPDPRTIYPGISEHMCRVIQKATAKQPEDRFQTCAAFIKGLKKDDFALLDSVKNVVPTPLNVALENDVQENSTAENEFESEKIIVEDKSEKQVVEENIEKPIVSVVEPHTQTSLPKNEQTNTDDRRRKMILMIGGGIVAFLIIIFFLSSGEQTEVENSGNTNEESTKPDVKTIKEKQVISEKPESQEEKVKSQSSAKTNKSRNQEVIKGDKKKQNVQDNQNIEEVNPVVERAAVERANPSKFISISFNWKKTLLDDIKVDLRISNNATYTSYSQFVLKVTYYDKNGDYKGENSRIVSTAINPGYYLENEIKFTPPFGVKDIDIQLVSVRTNN